MSAAALFRYLYRIERARGMGRIRSAWESFKQVAAPMPF